MGVCWSSCQSLIDSVPRGFSEEGEWEVDAMHSIESVKTIDLGVNSVNKAFIIVADYAQGRSVDFIIL